MRVKAPSTKVLISIAAATAIIVGACIPPPTGGGGGGPATTVLPTLPPPAPEDDFARYQVLSGLTAPVSVEFANDGRVFVAEKSGILKTFETINDPTPTVAADLTGSVRNIGDHGMLGLTVDPQWPDRPYVYVFYTWDITGLWGNSCAAGYATNGCVTGAKLSRLTMNPATGVMAGPEHVLEDSRWCFQFASHGVGDLQFLDDGTLVAAAGEGAGWTGTDYGQRGGQQPLFGPTIPNLTPVNPCDDPPNGIGGPVNPQTSEGGAFRSQDLLTSGDPLGWSGSMVRVDPDTGDAPADNPLVGDGDPDNDHVIAHGFRNPFRFTVRPGTDEVFVANVGFTTYEEIEVVDVSTGIVPNFGWPCHEGPAPEPQYSQLNNFMCDLMESPDVPSVLTDPWFAYARPNSGASIAGLEFVPDSGNYPAETVGQLMFADYVLGQTYLIGVQPDGSADPAGPRTVMRGGIPVDLTAGPDGFIYMVDYLQGSVLRIVDRATSPIARIEASAIDGPLPFSVTLDASSSGGPPDQELTYSWDLTGNGLFNDATGPVANLTINEAINRTVSVLVEIPGLASSQASVTLYPGNTPPEVDVQVTTPLPWSANDDISFTISATDAEDGALPAAAISWESQINHCYAPDDCHIHPYTGASGSTAGTISGPSHGYPSFLLLIVEATDSRGQTTRVVEELFPEAIDLLVTSDPPGAFIQVGESSGVTPFTLQVIRNDTVSLTTPLQHQIDGATWQFNGWSHGGGRNQDFFVGGSDTSINLNLRPA